jgi:phage-related minor tail protein
MSVLRSVETAAETVAVLSETVAEAAGAVDDVVESGRSLLKLLILALIGLAVVAAVVKMVKGHGQAPAAELDQSVEAGGSEETEGV